LLFGPAQGQQGRPEQNRPHHPNGLVIGCGLVQLNAQLFNPHQDTLGLLGQLGAVVNLVLLGRGVGGSDVFRCGGSSGQQGAYEQASTGFEQPVCPLKKV
jgi:hypothetical protein